MLYRRLLTNIMTMRRCYSKRVIDHFETPRNVGSLDKNDKTVGTGLVGAPACIHEDTIIAVGDESKNISVKELYFENRIFPVWSYNITNNIYEIKNARVIKNNFKKPMKKIIFADDGFIICTFDHKFLLQTNNYLEVENINNEPIVPFTNSKYVDQCNDYIIKKVEDIEGEFDCYDLQVEENNNFAVITNETSNSRSGIIIKNCGDVMKIQIKVDDSGKIVDTKFKTFGCGSAQASSSLATEWIQGKKIDEAVKITNRDIAKHLNLPPVKNHCSLLSEDAIKAAVSDYKKKNDIK